MMLSGLWRKSMPSSGKITTAAVDIRAKRVIRLHELPAFLGVKRSQISEAIRAGRFIRLL